MDVKKKVATFFSQFPKHEYKKGDILIHADEDPSGIFYIGKGIVKEYAISKKGDILVVNLFKQSAFFPMSWALNNTKNKYFFEAVTPLIVYKAPKDAVITYIKEHPDVLFDLMQRVYKGTDGILTRMVYLMSGSAYKRLITEILIYGKRFGEQNPQGGVSYDISETELAAHAGMTRETISRQISQLKQKNLIEFSKNTLVIPDIQKLEEELLDDF